MGGYVGGGVGGRVGGRVTADYVPCVRAHTHHTPSSLALLAHTRYPARVGKVRRNGAVDLLYLDGVQTTRHRMIVDIVAHLRDT